MFLAYLTMITALTISSVAIYYSVAGLAAIFSASVIPIVIMGSVLEVAKLVTAVWLHKYWSMAVWWLKTYLSMAVIVLMLITSMGIFGFLSKAHIEQTFLSNEQISQVKGYEENITSSQEKINRWNIELDRLYSGSDVRVDSLLEKEQNELTLIYERIENQKSQARSDADRKIAIQNNRLSQAQERKKQDIDIANSNYTGEELSNAISRATANELSVASAVQRQIITINNQLSNTLDEIDSSFQSQIDDVENRISDLRSQSSTTTENIDSRVAELENFIAEEQRVIVDLQSKKSNAEREYRKIEAEVGPVKYIAEFVYGPDADKNLLEEAVRWVIVTIIFVFDPLAVLLLIASQYTFESYSRNRIIDNNSNEEEYDEEYEEYDYEEEYDEEYDEEYEEYDYEEEYEEQPETNLDELAKSYLNTDDNIARKPMTEEDRKKAYELADKTPTWNDAKSEWKAKHPNETLKEYKRKYIRGQIDSLPWEKYIQNEEQNTNSLWQKLKDAQDNSNNTTG